MSDFDLRFSGSSIDAFFQKPVPRIASSGTGKIRVADVRSLTQQGFSHVGTDTLVNVSTKDFWKIGQDDQGFYIEQLVDDSSGPVEG